MLSLSAKIRQESGKKVKSLRKKGILPAVLYGPKIKKALSLEIDEKGFERIYEEAGESSLVSLEVEGPEGKQASYGAGKKIPVLIHKIAKDSLTDKPIHVDFYQPSLEKEVEVTIPIIFEGEAPAVKDLGGTLVKNISEIKIKTLPQNLPHEIKVNIEGLKTFEENILIKDLMIPTGVKILKSPEEIVAQVTPPEKVEEELKKPVEEKVGEVEKVEKAKEVKEVKEEETTTRPKGGPLKEEE